MPKSNPIAGQSTLEGSPQWLQQADSSKQASKKEKPSATSLTLESFSFVPQELLSPASNSNQEADSHLDQALNKAALALAQGNDVEFQVQSDLALAEAKKLPNGEALVLPMIKADLAALSGDFEQAHQYYQILNTALQSASYSQELQIDLAKLKKRHQLVLAMGTSEAVLHFSQSEDYAEKANWQQKALYFAESRYRLEPSEESLQLLMLTYAQVGLNLRELNRQVQLNQNQIANLHVGQIAPSLDASGQTVSLSQKRAAKTDDPFGLTSHFDIPTQLQGLNVYNQSAESLIQENQNKIFALIEAKHSDPYEQSIQKAMVYVLMGEEKSALEALQHARSLYQAGKVPQTNKTKVIQVTVLHRIVEVSGIDENLQEEVINEAKALIQTIEVEDKKQKVSLTLENMELWRVLTAKRLENGLNTPNLSEEEQNLALENYQREIRAGHMKVVSYCEQEMSGANSEVQELLANQLLQSRAAIFEHDLGIALNQHLNDEESEAEIGGKTALQLYRDGIAMYTSFASEAAQKEASGRANFARAHFEFRRGKVEWALGELQRIVKDYEGSNAARVILSQGGWPYEYGIVTKDGKFSSELNQPSFVSGLKTAASQLTKKPGQGMLSCGVGAGLAAAGSIVLGDKVTGAALIAGCTAGYLGDRALLVGTHWNEIASSYRAGVSHITTQEALVSTGMFSLNLLGMYLGGAAGGIAQRAFLAGGTQFGSRLTPYLVSQGLTPGAWTRAAGAFLLNEGAHVANAVAFHWTSGRIQENVLKGFGVETASHDTAEGYLLSWLFVRIVPAVLHANPAGKVLKGKGRLDQWARAAINTALGVGAVQSVHALADRKSAHLHPDQTAQMMLDFFFIHQGNKGFRSVLPLKRLQELGAKLDRKTLKNIIEIRASIEKAPPPDDPWNNGGSGGQQLAFATATVGGRAAAPNRSNSKPSFPLIGDPMNPIVMMSQGKDREGIRERVVQAGRAMGRLIRGGKLSKQAREQAITTLRDDQADLVDRANKAADLLEDRGSDSKVQREALAFFKNQASQLPEASAEMEALRSSLIGRRNIDSKSMNQLAQLLGPKGYELYVNPDIKKVLIANRGEIALRIAKTLRQERVGVVVIVTEYEVNSSWAQRIKNDYKGQLVVVSAKKGETPKQVYDRAYLDINHVLKIGRSHKVQALHPGYGYLSENADFAKALKNARIALVGPSVESMERAGHKYAAKVAFEKAGVPVAPGTKGQLNVEDLIAEIRQLELPYPLRLKATSGGGGRGQKTVYSEAEVRKHFFRLSKEAKDAFGSGELMAEIFVPRFHHVEFQMLADRFGNVVHLGERECTLQENDQKLIEIHPASIFNRFPGLREKMAQASVQAARAMGYAGHGTVEFMVNPDTGEFFALEVNARIQVEHRVTEAVTVIEGTGTKRDGTSMDLIEEGLNIARGLPLSVAQEHIKQKGAAVEIRIKAFTPGRVTRFEVPVEEGVFVESSVREGDPIIGVVDPMITKIVVTGKDRAHAIERAVSVLGRVRIEGKIFDGKGKETEHPIKTDLDRQLALLKTKTVQKGWYDNRFVGRWKALKGDDHAVYAHQEQTILKPKDSSPIHIQTTSPFALPEGAAELAKSAVEALLHGNEATEQTFRLQGALAEALRQDTKLRDGLLKPQGKAGQQVWVQVGPEGDLRSVAIIENQRPVRLVFVQEARQAREAKEPSPVVFDVDLKNNTAKALNIGSGGVEKSTGQSGKNGSNQIRFFGANQLKFGVQHFPLEQGGAVEVRGAKNELLLSLTPAQVIERPAERLLFLFGMLEAEIPKNMAEARNQQIEALIRDLAARPSEDKGRREVLEEVGSASILLAPHLLALEEKLTSPKERSFLDELYVRQELTDPLQKRFQFDAYQALPEGSAVVRFREQAEGEAPVQRLMIRAAMQAVDWPAHKKQGNVDQALQEAVKGALKSAWKALRQATKQNSQAQENAIQIKLELPDGVELESLSEPLTQWINDFYSTQQKKSQRNDVKKLKRITFLVRGKGDYPHYESFIAGQDSAGNRTGVFTLDPNTRRYGPTLAYQIELDRLSNFTLSRDAQHSEPLSHLYYGTAQVDFYGKSAKDERLFGRALIPEAKVVQGSSAQSQRIPALEDAFANMAKAMDDSLKARDKRQRPTWNRMFFNVATPLEVSKEFLQSYLKNLLEQNHEKIKGLALERIVFKVRLQDPGQADAEATQKAPRTFLLRFENAGNSDYREVNPNHNEIRRVPVVEEDGSVRVRDVLSNFDHPDVAQAKAIPYGNWKPADIPVRPMTPVEVRRNKSQRSGAVFAYDVPELIDSVAEGVRKSLGLAEKPKTPSTFVELELDPNTTRTNKKTGQIDYNVGELIPAVDELGKPRPIGQNKAGVVIGLKTDDLGIGEPVKRVMIIGDLTHQPGQGSLSANECARINAAIRYAAKHGLPVDWYTASAGAEIPRPPEKRGVEGLDATASTVREIVQLAHDHGVPINIMVMNYNIGAQSYWNSLAAIIHDTGGVLIMVPGLPKGKNAQSLTGSLALTAAAEPTTPLTDLPNAARKRYPNGFESLAGYEVHGPNAEAMAKGNSLADATEKLLRHHYYSYTQQGEIVGKRNLGETNPKVPTDITQLEIPFTDARGNTRTMKVGEALDKMQQGRNIDPRIFLQAIRDPGSPEPLYWWSDAKGATLTILEEAVAYFKDLVPKKLAEKKLRLSSKEKGDPLQMVLKEVELALRSKMPRPVTTIVAEMQLGGQPTMVIVPPRGPLTPADSLIIARALHKASGRMPALIMGSLKAFDAETLAMQEGQLLAGASIAKAVTEFKGPVTVVNMGQIIGGAYVVVSKSLNPHLTMLALRGTNAQVIGGNSAAVVFRSTILKEAAKDPAVQAAKAAMEQAESVAAEKRQEAQTAKKHKKHAQRVADEKAQAFEMAKQTYEQTYQDAVNRIAKQYGTDYDQLHTVERAKEVGAVDEVIEPKDLRGQIIHFQDKALEKYRADQKAAQEAEADRQLTIAVHLALNNPVGFARALAKTVGEGSSSGVSVGLTGMLKSLGEAFRKRDEPTDRDPDDSSSAE